MWYIGIILIIILFIAYMRSNMKNETEESLTKSESEEKEKPIVVETKDNNYRSDYRIHRPATFRSDKQMRTSRHSKRSINRHSDGTPRGGGTGGNRGNSNNVGPSGGRR